MSQKQQEQKKEEEVKKQSLLEEVLEFKEPKGLKYLKNFLTKTEEREILQEIYQKPWNQTLKRRTQHYGYEYDYKSKNIKKNYLGPLPNFVESIVQRLKEYKFMEEEPDQLIINEYTPGQGISAHIDRIDNFKKDIVSISLGSDCVMVFEDDSKQVDVVLRKRSLVALTHDARFKWKHSIPSRQSDQLGNQTIIRKTRVSLTFRKTI